MEKSIKRVKKPLKTKKKTKKITKAQLKAQKRQKLPKAERSEAEKKILHLKLNRAIGQLNGIKKMVDDDRMCEDILIQLSAVKSAVEATKAVILKELFAEMPHYQEMAEDKLLDKVLAKIKKY